MVGKRKTKKTHDKQGRAKSINFIVIAILLSLAVLATVGWWVSSSIVSRANQNTENSLNATWSQTVLRGFDNVYERQRQDLANLALLPLVRQAVQSQNADQRSEAGRIIRSQRDQIITLSIVGQDQLAPNTARTPPLSYASIDLINRVRRGQDVPAEFFTFQNRRLLNWAFAVRNTSGEIIGALQVVTDTSALRSYLTSQDPSFGEISLTQSLPQVSPELMLNTATEDTSEFSLATINPHWRLGFTPSTLLSEQAQVRPWTIRIPVILAAVFITVILAVAGLQLQSRLQRDANMLSDWLQAVIERRRVALPQFYLLLFADLARQVSLVTQRIRQTGAPQQSDIDLTPSDDTLPDADIMSMITGQAAQPVKSKRTPLKPEIFRAYDIRGIYQENIDESVAEQIGQAIGSEALDLSHQKILVARDGRNSSPTLSSALIKGLRQTGIHVIDLGMVPTPMMYFATRQLETGAGVMITGSHNPPSHNGFKVVLGNRTLSGMDIQNLWRRASNEDFSQGQGELSKANIVAPYAQALKDDIHLHRRLKVVVDTGNGATSPFAGALLRDLGCQAIMLGDQVDGNFPLRSPDPSQPDNLSELVKRVQENGADLGIAFDGDGDRMAVITSKGRYIWSDRLLALFAKQILKQTPDATIVYDVKCSRRLSGMIESFGGHPVMWKSGHSLIKQQMQKTQAILGGEMTGHFFFADRWNGFDDGIYAAARLIELISQSEMDADFLFSGFPDDPCTPEIIIPVPDTEKFSMVEKLSERIANLPNTRISTIDGVRVEFSDGWGLVRPSNTTAAITCRFEADTEEALARIQTEIARQVKRIKPDISLPF